MAGWIVTFDKVAKEYGVSPDGLLEQGVITEKEAELIRSGDVQAIRLSTLDRLCAAIGCAPGDFFAKNEAQGQ